MADRTWEERGKWMDAHRAQLTHWGDNSASVLYYVGEHVKAGPQMPRATDAIDLAIAECEAAERAKAEEERTRQERSPVAALAGDLASSRYGESRMVGNDLRDAIKAQAQRWCAMADMDANEPFRRALRRCADDLEGKA